MKNLQLFYSSPKHTEVERLISTELKVEENH